MARHRNHGLRKLCRCLRRNWSKCPHSWHFSFKHEGVHHRFSLDRHLGEHIDSKTAAETAATNIKADIRAGRFGLPAARDEMTLRQLADTYLERYVAVERSDTAPDFRSGLRVICGTPLPRPTGAAVPFGAWRLVDIVTDTIERYRETRRATGTGTGGTNRSLSRLRALFTWAVRRCDPVQAWHRGSDQALQRDAPQSAPERGHRRRVPAPGCLSSPPARRGRGGA